MAPTAGVVAGTGSLGLITTREVLFASTLLLIFEAAVLEVLGVGTGREDCESQSTGGVMGTGGAGPFWEIRVDDLNSLSLVVDDCLSPGRLALAETIED